MNPKRLYEKIIDKLDNQKAQDILAIDVKTLTTITDFMIICTATSERHANAVFNHLMQSLKSEDISPLSKDNQSKSDWRIIDYGDVIVHIMQDSAREFYQLEKLWTLREETVNQ